MVSRSMVLFSLFCIFRKFVMDPTKFFISWVLLSTEERISSMASSVIL